MQEAQQFSSDNTVAASDTEETVGAVEGEEKKNLLKLSWKGVAIFSLFSFHNTHDIGPF